MSGVLAANRNESRYEPIIFSRKINDILMDLMRRNFGMRNLEDFVRRQYANGKLSSENFDYYFQELHYFKTEIHKFSLYLTDLLTRAYYRYPTSMREYEERRSLLDDAIGTCGLLIGYLNKIATIFKVDINCFSNAIISLEKEIKMIKKWRQRDNKFKKKFSQGTV